MAISRRKNKPPAKVCLTCGRSSDVVSFNNSQRTRCVDCHGRAMAVYRSTDASRISARRSQQAYYRKNKSALNLQRPERSMRRTKEQQSAYNKVAYALRHGSLTKQPCEICGNESVHAHHDDYARPLDVRWLCSEHHGQHHAALQSTAPTHSKPSGIKKRRTKP